MTEVGGDGFERRYRSFRSDVCYRTFKGVAFILVVSFCSHSLSHEHFKTLTLYSAKYEKGVIILNEVGLDPGIDHLLVMKAVDAIHAKGGTVTELISLCGGLPDPICADNPLRYKFSWSPRYKLLSVEFPNFPPINIRNILLQRCLDGDGEQRTVSTRW
jgi:hypothetical protein